MFQKKRIITAFLIASTFVISSSFGQTVQKKLQWSVAKSDIRSSGLDFSGANTGERYNRLPYFSETVKATSFNAARLINPVFEPFNGTLTEEQKNRIGNEIHFTSAVSFEKKQANLTVSLLPFRKNPSTGTIERLASFDIQYYNDPTISMRSGSSRTYASNSVLASGNWYKVAVSTNGIYKLTYNDLKALGIDVASIDPRNIRVYGNGGGILPEKNREHRYDDLYENPVKVIGENDGVMNENDYVLFYAKGPDQWKYHETRKAFIHETNPYSAEIFYFITADLGPGKRIPTDAGASSPNFFVNTFNDYIVHETDRSTAVNTTIKSGRERYGEEFNNQLSYDFNFNFPNLVKTSKVKVRTIALGRSTGVSSAFSVKFNNSPLYTILCAPVTFDYDKPYGTESERTDSMASASDNIQISITYNKPNSSSIGFLNYIEVNALRNLTMSGDQMQFRNASSAAAGRITSFTIGNTIPSTEVWDISDRVNPRMLALNTSSNTKSFTVTTDTLREFIAFNNTQTPSPSLIGRVANQNLHATGFPDLIIFSHPDFLAAAERLADYRRQNNGLDVLIITPEKLYNEFSCGARDASAIRDFLKMLYDRAGTDQSKMPRYLLLMGDGSYDNKGIITNNTNYLPTFESRSSNVQYGENGSYVSDDYFGMLDDIEGGWDIEVDDKYGSNAIDVAVGRLPVQTPDQAMGMVNKILHYTNPETFGDWRNKYVLIADDDDNNTHFSDAETNYRSIQQRTKKFNIDKIYFDAYPQISIPAGQRYPAVNTAINNTMSSGCLIMNYAGHGGETGLGHEEIMTLDDIHSWTNYNRMPLMVTATCSFSRWDDPAFQSAGEQCLLNPIGGAIALFTTTRVVNAGGNLDMNQNFIEALLDTVVNNGLTLGDVFVRSKNLDGALGLDANNRNFTLLGDPSLPFAIPRLNVMTDKINGVSIKDTASVDTLKALSKVTITGYLTDANGNKLTNYNGVVYPLVFAKKTIQKTLGQDAGSRVATFELQKNVIYKGKSSVQNGEFTYTFVVPKDISYAPGYGRLSYYSNTGNTDANGSYDSVVVGGSSNAPVTDHKGPDINIFLNNENFASGGLTGENPKLIVKLKDDNGINTVGNGIGHNLMATLIKDGKEETIELNNYYEAKLDSYQEGEINYPMSKLAPGKYQLKVKAWDVFNNSNENSTEFWVSESKDFTLDHVLNYPNPFTTLTDFQFEHNRPGDDLDVQVQVFTVSGKLVKTIQQSIFSTGSRVTNIKWDGRDDYGDKIGRGVYLYKLKVRSSDGSIADKYEKLVILN